MDRYIKLLGGVKRLIARGQKNALRRVLAGAKKKRDKLFYRAEN
jgi:hypothetical protein